MSWPLSLRILWHKTTVSWRDSNVRNDANLGFSDANKLPEAKILTPFFSNTSEPHCSEFQDLIVKHLSLNNCSPRDQSLSDLLYSKAKANFEKPAEIPVTTSGHLQLHTLIICNSSQHFAGNSKLFPIWHHSLRNVACSWHSAVTVSLLDVMWPWTNQWMGML